MMCHVHRGLDNREGAGRGILWVRDNFAPHPKHSCNLDETPTNLQLQYVLK